MDILNEGKLTEALKPIDKKVVKAFYDKKSLEGKLLNTDGKTLDKLGMGRDTVAVWKGNNIIITSKSAVKSDDTILRFLKQYVPKLNFDKKSYNKYFNEGKLNEEAKGYKQALQKKIQMFYEALSWDMPVDKKNTLERFF